jgi:uncharacterized protein with NRDE domain
VCLCAINYRPDHDWPLLLVANRDEFRDRPAEAMHWWSPTEQWPEPVLAGRDRKAGGTWLAADQTGRIALLTNIRPGYLGRTGERSRGELPLSYLQNQQSIEDFHQAFLADLPSYAGFNLVLFDTRRLFWFSADHPRGAWLTPGIHGLSNDAMNTSWPKVEMARSQMKAHHQRLEVTPWQSEGLLDLPILSDPHIQPDAHLPNTGVPLDWERTLSAQTITADHYGTRCRTWIAVHRNGQIQVSESQLKADGTLGKPERFSWQY